MQTSSGREFCTLCLTFPPPNRGKQGDTTTFQSLLSCFLVKNPDHACPHGSRVERKLTMNKRRLRDLFCILPPPAASHLSRGQVDPAESRPTSAGPPGPPPTHAHTNCPPRRLLHATTGVTPAANMATRTTPTLCPRDFLLPEGAGAPHAAGSSGARPLPVAELHAGPAGAPSPFCASPLSRNAKRCHPQGRSFSPSNCLRQEQLRVRCRSAQPSAGSAECSIRNKLRGG